MRFALYSQQLPLLNYLKSCLMVKRKGGRLQSVLRLSVANSSGIALGLRLMMLLTAVEKISHANSKGMYESQTTLQMSLSFHLRVIAKGQN